MKNKRLKIAGVAALLCIGIALVAFSAFGEFTDNTKGVLIGLGSGIVGASIAQLLIIKTYSNNPDKLKQKTIEVNDERNVIIRSRAKAATYTVFTYVFSALLLCLVILGLKPIWLIAAVLLYLIRFIIEMLFIKKYMSEM